MSTALDQRVARGMQAQFARRNKRLKAGDRVIGWKVGFGAPAAMQSLGITAPLVGYLLQSAQVQPDATVSLAGWVKPVAEPEIAVHLGSDLPGGGDRAAAAAAIAALGPAIELADMDRQPTDVEAILGGNIYQRHVMLGARDEARAGGRVDGLSGRVFRRGAEVVRTDAVEHNTGNLVALVRHVADLLDACGERLCAGQFVICGSIVPPPFIDPDEDRIEYALDPIGLLAVRFVR